MNRFFKHFAARNLTLAIIIGQAAIYLAINSGLISYNFLSLNYSLILQGEVWRVVSFLFIPPGTSPVWAILSWYILYLMGSNLENYWGELHYTLYVGLAVLLTNLVSFLFGLTVTSNYYLQSSIFLAFAFLNPNFQVRVFFILPVKIKWIAILNWIFYAWMLIAGGLAVRLLILASLMNFAIFFSKDIYHKIRYRGKRVGTTIKTKVQENRPKHVCAHCGKSDITHPYMDFRYCSTCNPEQCYCEEHILDHEHKG